MKKELVKKLYECECFEEIILFNNGSCTETFKRVPGGWIYVISNPNGITSCFVPYDNGFKIIGNN